MDRKWVILGSWLLLFLMMAVSLAAAADFVGSAKCKVCHQKQYKEWQGTYHSKMVQDAKADPKAIVGDFSAPMPDTIPYKPKKDEVMFTSGSKWKQRYVFVKDGEWYVFPAQWNVATKKWVPYNPKKWDATKWSLECAGCHHTGFNPDSKKPVKDSYADISIGCEACHGPGSDHLKSKKEDKKKTIVNPKNLSADKEAVVCGQCHNRGHSAKRKELHYAWGYKVGEDLNQYFESTPLSDMAWFWPNGNAKGHREQYIDWKNTTHAQKGVTCTKCHNPHSSARNNMLRDENNALCASCHKNVDIVKHSHHAAGKGPKLCIDCHMALVATTAEKWDEHSHTFKVIPPSETIKQGGLDKQLNSCNACHKDKTPEWAQTAFDKWYKK